MSINRVIGHETKHLLEANSLKKDYNEILFEYAKEQGDFEAYKDRIIKLYGDEKGNIDSELLESELSAELTANYLFTDEKFIDSLMESNNPKKKTIIQKIKELIDDLVKRFKGTEQEDSLMKLQNKFRELYEQDVTVNNEDGTVIYSLNNSNKDESKQITNIIYKNIENIAGKEIFSVEYDNNAENYKNKSEYVLEVFNTQGGMAYNEKIGKIELVKSGAKSTIAHGFGKEKLASVKAIKDVVEKGTIISYTSNYMDSGVDRYVIAGKGKIDSKSAYVGVVIKSYPRTKNNSKFYLHEAIIIEADSLSMTAPQLSVDTVGESALYNKIVNSNTEKVKTSSQKDSVFLNGEIGPVGEKKLHSFAGSRARTTNSSLLLKAEHMLDTGVDGETVRQETGWYKGYDGRMRFEIDDSESEIIESPKLQKHSDNDETYYTGKLSDIFNHKKLYEAYPELQDINIVIQETEFGVRGIYQPSSNYITLDIKLFQKPTKEYNNYLNGDRNAEIKRIEQTPEYQEYNKIYDDDYSESIDPELWEKEEREARDKFFSSELGKRYHQLMYGKYDGKKYEFGETEQAKKTLIHEIQHAIQKIEGFTGGSSVEYWQKNYLDNGIPIRSVQDRKKIRELRKEYWNISDNEPEFFRDMSALVAPDMPRGAVDWDKLEQIEDDPIEWQEYDKKREETQDRIYTEKTMY